MASIVASAYHLRLTTLGAAGTKKGWEPKAPTPVLATSVGNYSFSMRLCTPSELP